MGKQSAESTCTTNAWSGEEIIMPIPLYDPRMDWRNRIPAEQIGYNPKNDLLNALLGTTQGLSTAIGQDKAAEEAQRVSKQDELMKMLALGNMPQQQPQMGTPLLPAPSLQPNLQLPQQNNMGVPSPELPNIEQPDMTNAQVQGRFGTYIPKPSLEQVYSYNPVSGTMEKLDNVQKGAKFLTEKDPTTGGRYKPMTDEAKTSMAKRIASGGVTTEELLTLEKGGGQGKIDYADILDKVEKEAPGFQTRQFIQAAKFDNDPSNKQLRANISTAYKDIQSAKEASDSIKRTNFKDWNSFSMAFKNRTGNVATSMFNSAMTGLSDSLANALGPARASATDQRLKLAAAATDPKESNAQFNSALIEIKKFLKNRQDSLDEQGVKGYLSSLKKGSSGNTVESKYSHVTLE